MPASTLRAWVRGVDYSEPAKRRFEPLVRVPSGSPTLLTFTNVVELHVLSAIRRHHAVPMPKVRDALDYVAEHLHVDHPLASESFQTDGVDLFIERWGRLLAVSRNGQVAMRHLLARHLERIDRDPEGLASRLWPFTRSPDIEQPRTVVLDPRIAFGRPVLANTGIPTEVLAERYKAGDTIHDLARDYGLQTGQVEEAIRVELLLAA